MTNTGSPRQFTRVLVGGCSAGHLLLPLHEFCYDTAVVQPGHIISESVQGHQVFQVRTSGTLPCMIQSGSDQASAAVFCHVTPFPMGSLLCSFQDVVDHSSSQSSNSRESATGPQSPSIPPLQARSILPACPPWESPTRSACLEH